MKKLIVHVSEAEVSSETGMGRIAWHWKKEFERRGYDFLHIGPAQVGPILHPGLFPYAAYQTYRKLKRTASIFLVHEPASGVFVNRKIPVVVFSHGLEQRNWQLTLGRQGGNDQKIALRTKLLFPLWRLKQCDLGLRKANLILLSNEEDFVFLQNYYQRDTDCLYIFKNGVYPSALNEQIQPSNYPTVAFLGSWIQRKGISSLVKAAQILQQRDLSLKWLLAGTGVTNDSVLSSWPNELHPGLEIISNFSIADEESLFARSNIFLLPSLFEGQPLSLLQAMETGRCCITTNCCGQRDLIEHMQNGLLYEPGNAQKLASLIEQSIKQEEIRIKLGKNAKLSVKSRRWETVAAEVVARIETMLHEYEASLR